MIEVAFSNLLKLRLLTINGDPIVSIDRSHEDEGCIVINGDLIWLDDLIIKRNNLILIKETFEHDPDKILLLKVANETF